MYSKTSAANRTRKKRVIADPSRLRVLQNDLDDDVARVAATVDGLFDHFVKRLEDHELPRLVVALVKLLEQREHHLVGLALGVLQTVVGLADLLDGGAAAELLHHVDDGFGGLEHKLGLALKRGVRHAAGI